MLFANPLFLFGLLAVVIPVIIHLFNFRRFKRFYFTNVKFLEELKKETRKKSELRHLIILFLRILAVASLVMAFARPYIPFSEQTGARKGRKVVSVYLDNSFSMEARGTSGTLLDEARQKAVEVANAHEPDDIFHLITNDFQGKHQRLVSRDEYFSLINDVTISPAYRSLAEVAKRQFDLITGSENKNITVYYISDFQKETMDLSGVPLPESALAYFVPLHANITPNVFIDSVWFDSPHHRDQQLENLSFRLRNASDQDMEKVPVRLVINQNQRNVGSFDLTANSSVIGGFTYVNNRSGIQQAMLEVTDYPVTYDDRFYFSYSVTSSIPVLCIEEEQENSKLDRLFNNDSAFDYTSVSYKKLDYSSFSFYRLIILKGLNDISSGLAQELKRFVDAGGNLLIFPSQKPDQGSYNDFLGALNVDVYGDLDTIRTKISQLNLQHPLYRGVFEKIPENLDLPVVFKSYTTIGKITSGKEWLIRTEKNEDFLSVFPVGRGKAYLLTVAFDQSFSNFMDNWLFIPTMYNIALLSGSVQPLAFTIGKSETMEIPYAGLKGDEVFKIRSDEGNFEIIPEHRTVSFETKIFFRDQIPEAGTYTLGTGNNKLSGIAFNYDRKESVLDYLEPDEIKNQAVKAGWENSWVISVKDKPLGDAIKEMNQGIKLWKWFIILALLFLAFEIILLRFWK